jgi:hypothetical protein
VLTDKQKQLLGYLKKAVMPPAWFRSGSTASAPSGDAWQGQQTADRCRLGRIGQHHHPPGTSKPDITVENRHNTISS